MNKEYIKKHNMSEALEKFFSLCNESYIPMGMVEEEGEAEEQQNQDPNAGGDPNAMPPMGDPNGGMGAPPADPNGGMGTPPADPNAGADPNGGMDPNAGADPNAMPPMGDPNGGMDPNAMPPMDNNEPEPEEEDDVIDVDDLTQAQEKIYDKENVIGKNLGNLDMKFTSLTKALDNIKQSLDKNNNDIEILRKELAQRCPTQTERLNLRSLAQYPYNDSPTDFWARKTAENGNYAVQYDNNQPTTEEYKLTDGDIENYNTNDIANSFGTKMKDLFPMF